MSVVVVVVYRVNARARERLRSIRLCCVVCVCLVFTVLSNVSRTCRARTIAACVAQHFVIAHIFFRRGCFECACRLIETLLLVRHFVPVVFHLLGARLRMRNVFDPIYFRFRYIGALRPDPFTRVV